MALFKHSSPATRPLLPIFSQLNDEMNRFLGRDLPLFNRPTDLLAGEWSPEIDVEQRDNRYIVQADIPGVNPKDIKVSIENGNLIIEGKRETKAEENRQNYRRIERRSGNFYRCLTLPDASEEAKKMEAHCRNGVLEIIVPKMESSKLHKIEVKAD